MVEISVIIPVYNKEKRLSDSIQSVLNQTYKNFELILINDGSTDSSQKIIEKYKKIDDRVVVKEQLNSGVSFTRNKGIELSKGRYITFLDADDSWEERFLEKMIERIKNCNVCYSGHYINLEGKSRRARNVKYRTGDILTEYIYNNTAPHTNSWLIRKDFLNTNNIRFSETLSWGEDMLFFIKVLSNDENVQCVSESLTTYYMKQEDSLSENNLDKIEKDIEWIQLAISYLKTKKKNTDTVMTALFSYRLPTAIVYRVSQNIGIEDYSILKEKMAKYQSYLDGIRLSNGLRSIKLMTSYFKVKSMLALKN